MIATLKETITSLKDPKYGSVIITKPVKPVIWYWTKYLILISLIPLMLIIFLLTRFLPQIPRLVRDRLPEGTLSMANHQLSSTISQPLRFEDRDFIFIFDLQASSSAIESLNSGIFITRDKIIAKSPDGQFQTQDYSNFPDFSVDKFKIADWIQTHRRQIWFFGLLVILIVGSVAILFTWVFRIVAFFIWSLVFWVVTKYLLKQELTYFQIFNLVIYASVLPLVLSLILAIAPNNFLSLLNLGIFIYFVYIWVRNLSLKKLKS